MFLYHLMALPQICYFSRIKNKISEKNLWISPLCWFFHFFRTRSLRPLYPLNIYSKVCGLSVFDYISDPKISGSLNLFVAKGEFRHTSRRIPTSKTILSFLNQKWIESSKEILKAAPRLSWITTALSSAFPHVSPHLTPLYAPKIKNRGRSSRQGKGRPA